MPDPLRRTPLVRLIGASLLSIWIASAAEAATCVTSTVPLASPTDQTRQPVAVTWTASGLALLKGDSAGNLWIGLYSETLTVLREDSLIATAWDRRPARVLWADSELALFYRDLTGNLRHVSWNPATGVIGGAGVLFPTRPLTSSRAFDVEWSGEFFAIAEATTSRPNPGLFVNRLDAGGNPVAEAYQFISISSSTWVDVEITDTTVLVATTYGQIPVQETLVFWTPHEVDRVHAGTDAIDGIDTRLGWNGESVLAIAVERGIGAVQDVMQAVLSPTGALLSGPSPFLPDASVAAVGDLLWNGDEYLFLWLEQGPTGSPTVRLARLARDRSVVTETGFISERQRRSHPPTTRLAWTGASAVAAFTRTVAGGALDSHLGSHCPLTASIDGPNLLLAGTESTWTARLEGGLPPWSYEWQVGGTGFGSAPSMTRRLSNPGTYTVRLVASDTLGARVVTTLDVVVVTTLPELEVSLDGPSSLRPGGVGGFEATVNGGVGDLEYSWTLGDGRAATGPAIEVSWPAPGMYTVTVNVTDGAGRSRSAQLVVVVEPVRRRAATRS